MKFSNLLLETKQKIEITTKSEDGHIITLFEGCVIDMYDDKDTWKRFDNLNVSHIYQCNNKISIKVSR